MLLLFRTYCSFIVIIIPHTLHKNKTAFVITEKYSSCHLTLAQLGHADLNHGEGCLRERWLSLSRLSNLKLFPSHGQSSPQTIIQIIG